MQTNIYQLLESWLDITINDTIQSGGGFANEVLEIL
jgi:hypothetical protein